MTAPARITQDDMTRVTKSVAAAGFECARIIFDFANQRAEVIIDRAATDSPGGNPWDEE